MNELFDLSAEYEAMLNRGIRYSGESMEYFLAGRLARVEACLGAGTGAGLRFLDFGCGIGAGSRAIGRLFSDASVIGVDSSESALDHARSHTSSSQLVFMTVDQLAVDAPPCDVCYVNGVFHHIVPEERPKALHLISRSLRPGGHFFFFENNPWNPGTRWVMSRIPFDCDAQTLSVPVARQLLQSAGFSHRRTETPFFFPRFLAFLRRSEALLGAHTLLGAQYMIWGVRS